jgi:hypothetical protein
VRLLRPPSRAHAGQPAAPGNQVCTHACTACSLRPASKASDHAAAQAVLCLKQRMMRLIRILVCACNAVRACLRRSVRWGEAAVGGWLWSGRRSVAGRLCAGLCRLPRHGPHACVRRVVGRQCGVGWVLRVGGCWVLRCCLEVSQMADLVCASISVNTCLCCGVLCSSHNAQPLRCIRTHTCSGGCCGPTSCQLTAVRARTVILLCGVC